MYLVGALHNYYDVSLNVILRLDVIVITILFCINKLLQYNIITYNNHAAPLCPSLAPRTDTLSRDTECGQISLNTEELSHLSSSRPAA